MNKGFILDGYPRNTKDAQAIFTEKVKKVNDDNEPKPADLPVEEKIVINEKIIPQFCIVFEAENDLLKQRVQRLPKEETEGTHFTDQHQERRTKFYRDQNATVQSDKHILKFFHEHIG